MLPSQTKLEDKMPNIAWCDKYPRDCARIQKQQEREWLHTHAVASVPLDIIVAAAVVGLCVLAML